MMLALRHVWRGSYELWTRSWSRTLVLRMRQQLHISPETEIAHEVEVKGGETIKSVHPSVGSQHLIHPATKGKSSMKD